MSEKTETILNIYREIIFCHYHLQAYGKKNGALTSKGLAIWNLLTSIQLDQQSTIAKLAKQRSVSRQYIQKQVKELINEKLVEFVDNPTHKKSKYLLLTTKGQIRLEKIQKTLLHETNKIEHKFETNLTRLSKDLLVVKKILVEEVN